MTILTPRSRLFESFAYLRRSSMKQQNTVARPPNLRSNRLVAGFCFGAIAIGIIALTGYVLGNVSIASLGTGKPVALVGRELRMIELKRNLNDLSVQLGNRRRMFFPKSANLPRRRDDESRAKRIVGFRADHRPRCTLGTKWLSSRIELCARECSARYT